MLQRSIDRRRLSRFRYHNAERFFVAIEQGVIRDPRDQLYQTGIVFQLGLSAHLLDVGFPDDWCARNMGLYVERSLAYANTAGLGLISPEVELLAPTLSPYSRWRDCLHITARALAAMSGDLTTPLLAAFIFIDGQAIPGP